MPSTPRPSPPPPGPPLAFHIDQLGINCWVQVGDHLLPHIQHFELRTSYAEATQVLVRGITDRDQPITFSGYLLPHSDVQVSPGHQPVYRETNTPHPALFILVRDKDISGVSGTGVVAEGIQYSDGRVSLRWVISQARSTVCYDSILDVVQIHGHDGATRVIWL